ncbi:MAG: methyltransferase domain-containing protein [Microthrixaceae bacterium]|nr:methyltransferase domain-containing protein [Microthrixaceae bacterium]
MDENQQSIAEAKRLENLWGSEFGDQYVERNADVSAHRGTFWTPFCARHDIGSALEVGCNIGANLRWISDSLPAGRTYGIDINREAIARAHVEVPLANVVWAPAREIPFRERHFDLVFTMGVLIHQPDATLPLVLSEMVRCSRRLVFFGEYFSEDQEEVPYRGENGALFRRNYGRIFADMFPDWSLLERGFLPRSEGWDDVTWWLFQRP